MKELYDLAPVKILPEAYHRTQNEGILIEKKKKFIKEINKLISVGVNVLCGRCKKELIGQIAYSDIKEKTRELNKTCTQGIIDKIANIVKGDELSVDIIKYNGEICLISCCQSCAEGEICKYNSFTLGSAYIHRVQNGRRHSVVNFSILNNYALKKKSEKGEYYIEIQLIIYAHHITTNQSFKDGVNSLFCFKNWFIDLHDIGSEAVHLKKEITSNFIKYYNSKRLSEGLQMEEFAVEEVKKFHGSIQFPRVLKYLFTNYENAKAKIINLKPKPSEISFIDDFKKVLKDYLAYIGLFISEGEKYFSLS
ncbi:hypothetical protein DICPUDRAFT_79182 [Dictyostelium purpureum]|uniref:Uncharacterized protein n=1 Tax=Dictyostelium purpureum TaxID=5786 RepID=F0ZLT6_DICPU|nr:uncharacterized protein DICPUDRAFT_79182 [Dictyostelium purpureum]EGC35071.1 hypothetical protein DICPUDRAFT_79182 [Dictyostelium purpureum]|eukprot:XP_003288378.1 hypothetical protein DICPUDRAFT_79182 [Dictyostelium purpureum]